MIQAFYQTNPVQDTPYRELVLEHEEGKGWHVLLLGGTKWGARGATTVSDDPVADFDNGKIVFDRIFEELRGHGWRAYTPYETWD